MKSLFSRGYTGRFKLTSRYICCIILLTFNILPAFAQEKLLAKHISITLSQVSIPEALSAIADKAGCTFSYSSSSLPAGKRVSIQHNDITLTAALKKILGNSLEKLEVQGNKVLIVLKKQTGLIKGTVKTSDGKPARLVTISIKDLTGTSTDGNGNYQLKGIPEGTYAVTASLVGIGTQMQQVTVQAAQTLIINFTLNENSPQLNEVAIRDVKRGKFIIRRSEDLAKMPLNNLENPQVYTTVTNELIKEQQLTNFNDALRNVQGISVLYANQAYGSATFSSRGFAVGANLRNGLSSYSNSDIDPANIEKIEVLKGPSATLFGSSLISWGGLINRVTKQPYNSFGGEVSYTGGSFGLSRFTADLNTPLKDSTVLFRLNVAHTNNGSFQDAGFTQSTFIAPVVTFRANDRLTITLEGEFYRREGTTPLSIYVFSPMSVHSVKDLDLNYNRSFTNNDIKVSSPSTNFFGKINYKLSSHWTSQTLASTTYSPQQGPYLWSSFTSAKGDSIQRAITDWNLVNTTTQIQQNFIGDHTFGKMRNRVVAGLDYFNSQRKGTYYYLPFDKVSLSNPGPDYLNISRPAINAKEATGTYGPNYDESNNYTYAAYVSDVFNLTDQLIINAALRMDRFDNKGSYDAVTAVTSGNYSQTALSPKFGVIYQPVKDQVAIFANYLNGFTNNTGTDYAGKAFKASNGNQLEGGIKLDLLDHSLSATASYYRIKANGLLETDPIHNGFSIQDGSEESKGVEISVIASPFSGFNIIGGYSHNDTKYIRFNNPWIWLDRPNEAGPANTANLYASYKFLNGSVKGLGFGFGANYSSDAQIGLILPAYTLLNASAFYDCPTFRIGFKMDNLTDTKYWTGYNDLAPQPTRNLSASLSVKF